MRFLDRVDAGRRLARELAVRLDTGPDGDRTVVLGLPRGGVPVAHQVAEALDAPLDVIIVRKLGLPEQPELAVGAIGEGGVRVVNRPLVRRTGLGETELAAVETAERRRLDARVRELRGGRPSLELTGRTTVVVDDGIATGATARAACEVARAAGASRVVLAVPVAPADSAAALAEAADQVVCLLTPVDFCAVGEWYADFGQVSDAEVAELLGRRRE